MRLPCCNAILAVAIALVSALGSPKAEAQTDPAKEEADLEIATGAKTELGPFSIGSKAFQRDLPLISKNQTEAKDVFVELLFVKGPDGVNSEQTDPKVGDKRKELKLDRIEGNTLRPVKISATLPAPGDYEFALLLRGKETKTYRVTVKRDAAQLTLLELAGGAKLNLESKSRKLVAPLTLRAEKSTAAHDVKVSVSSLFAPGGSSSQAKLSLGADGTKDGSGGNSIAIPVIDGLGIASFQLEADLPQSGEYSGVINLSYDGGEKVIPITVKRSLPSSGLDLKYAGVGRNPITLLKPSAIDLGIAVRESQGDGLSFGLPTVSGLTRTIGSTANIGAVTTSKKAFVGDKQITEKGSYPLAPAQAVDIRMELEGLGEPGVYSGKFVLPVEDRIAAEVPVSFSIRRPLIWAVVPITFGVLFSGLLRLWSTQLRGRMREARKVVARMRALVEVAKCIGIARPEEQDLMEAMRRPLDLAYLDLRSGESSDATAVIAGFDGKLPTLKRWIELNRQIAGLSLGNAVYELKAKLAQVARYLTGSDSGITNAEASATLQSLPGEIKAALLGMIDNFKAQQSKIGAGLDDSVLYARWVPEVDNRISAAQQYILNSDFSKAAAEVDGARLAGAKILGEDLRKKLDPRPGWMSQPLLDRIVLELDDVVKAAQAEAAMPPYRQALQRYLEALSKHLIGTYTALKSQLEGERANTQDTTRLHQIDQTIVAIDTQVAFLKVVPDQLSSGKFAEAKGACDVASAEFPDLSGAPAAAAVGGGAAGIPAADDIPKLTVELPIGDLPKNLEDIKAKETLIVGLTSLGNWVYQAAILVIAILLGVYVLWAGKADWGSETDILLAILWGLGLHSLTANTGAYAGVDDLASKLR